MTHLSALIYCLALTLMCMPAFGTYIVIFRTKTKITIGADSRTVRDNDQGTFTQDTDGACKIRRAGRFYYALSGNNEDIQENAAQLAQKRAKTVDEFADLFVEYATEQYKDFLTERRRQNIKAFAQVYDKYSNFAELAFFGIENQVPQLRIVGLVNVAELNEPIQIKATKLVNPAFMILGYRNEYNQLSPDEQLTMNNRVDNDPLKIIDSIIDYEKKFHPTIIGGQTQKLILSIDAPVRDMRKKSCRN